MSTLTKVLIVLLTVFSIFLCGIVVTYVANAANYRDQANQMRQDLDAARKAREAALADMEKGKLAAEALKNELGKEISDLKIATTDLQGQLNTFKRENSQLVQKLTDMAAVVETANATAGQQTLLFENAQKQVKMLEAEQSTRKKELDETNRVLLEKMTVIAQLDERARQLVEENRGLQGQLSQVLQRYGQAPVRPQTVTPQRAIAQPVKATATTKDIALRGQVTQVDMKNRMAAISIGSAAGVRQDMKFHVTRDDRFICDILILDVDPERAVGILDLVQAEPQPGDYVTTNL